MTFIPEEGKPNRWQKFAMACVVLGFLVLGLGFVISLLQEAAADDQPSDQVEATGSAMEALDSLRIVTHDIAPYDRGADFGGAWTDIDGNGCTTRQDVMARDAIELVDADSDCQPYVEGHCEFAAQQVAVKTKYDLGVTDAEYAALSDILAGCESQGLITTDDLAELPDVGHVPVLSGGNDVEPEAVNPAPVGDDVHYENCTQAREAGAAPVKEGEAGYGPHLDRDGDGVGCQ